MATKRKRANGAAVPKAQTSKAVTATTKAGKAAARTQLEPMKISGKLFLEYRAAMAEMFEARTRLKLYEEQLRQELLDEKYAPLLKLQRVRNDTLRDVAEKQSSFKDVQTRVCAKLGIPEGELVNYTINEYSGTIVFTPPKEVDEGSSANKDT